MNLLNLSVFCGVSVICFYLYVKKKLNYWQDRGVIHAAGNFLVGHLGDASKIHLSKKIHEMYQFFKSHDLFFGMYFYVRPVLVVTDLNFIKRICVEDFWIFNDRGFYVNTKSDPLSGHLYALKSETWRGMREKLKPAFTEEKLTLMFNTIVEFSYEICNVFGEYEKNNQTCDITNIYQRFTADVIGSCALGFQQCDAIKNDKSTIMQLWKKIFRPSRKQRLKILFMNTFQRISKLLKLKFFPKKISKFFSSSIKTAVEYRELNNIDKPDFLGSLIKLKNCGSITNGKIGTLFDRINPNELIGQSFSIFYSGTETSAATQSFCLLELAVNQNIQSRLRNEINKILEVHNGQITYEAISEMKYLDRVVNETLRKYSPVPSMIRKTSKIKYIVNDTHHKIARGTHILIPIYSIHHDERYYSEPSKFDPDRFLPEVIKSRPELSFIPFGYGHRNCLGIEFGLLMVKIGIISVLKSFKVSQNSRTIYPIKFNPLCSNIEAMGGIWLDFEKIK